MKQQVTFVLTLNADMLLWLTTLFSTISLTEPEIVATSEIDGLQ